MKTRTVKIALCVIALPVALYLLCFLGCAAALLKAQALTYHSTGWGVVLTEYRLDFKDGLAELNDFDFDGTRTAHTEYPFSAAQQRRVRLVCAAALMPLWREEYHNPHIFDGDQWHTIISYGKKEKRTYGSNSYPLTYRVVYDEIMSIFKESAWRGPLLPRSYIKHGAALA